MSNFSIGSIQKIQKIQKIEKEKSNIVKIHKSIRILDIYIRLEENKFLNKSNLAREYGVTEKTIQRDIEELRVYFSDKYDFIKADSIKYDRKKNLYYMKKR